MDKTKKTSLKNCISKIWKSEILSAITLNLLFLASILVFCDVKYEVSDDVCDFVRSLWGEFKSTFDFYQCPVGISVDPILSYFTRNQLVSYFSVITLFSQFYNTFIYVIEKIEQINGAYGNNFIIDCVWK